MSDKHFTLDIHPGELRAAATRVAELHEQLGSLRTQVGAAPGDIGNAWTGSAATSLKGEMTHLSTVLGTFKGKLDGVPGALRSLAKDYDEALEQLPGLNQKWDAAEQAYQDAVGAADTARNQARQELADSDRPPNRAITQEIDDIHSGAISAAASAKQSTQHGLETTFGYLKQWLAQQTRALGSTLHDAGPVNVSDDEVAKWNAGQSPKVDVSSITSQLTLAKENLDEVERLRIAPEVEDAIDRLQDALDNDTYESDPEEIQDALDAIAQHAGDPLWTKELVDQLKAEGIEDIYQAIDRDLELSEYRYEDIVKSLSGFSDAVAQGISAHDDPEFADLAEEFMNGVAGQKIWALITASDNADDRMASVALAYHTSITNGTNLDNAMVSGLGLFPWALADAYDGDAVQRLADRASGEALARVLEAFDAESDMPAEIARMLHDLDMGSGYPSVSEEDYRRLAEIYSDTIDAMHRHFTQAQSQPGRVYDFRALLALLEARKQNLPLPWADHLKVDLEQFVDDPAFMAALLSAADSQTNMTAADVTRVKELIGDSGKSIEDILGAVLAYRVQHGDPEDRAAANLGMLLRNKDILGEHINWSGTVTALMKELAKSGAALNPVTAAASPFVSTFIDEVLKEYDRIHQLDVASENKSSHRGEAEQLAFLIWTKYHGDPPGYQEFVEANEGTVKNPKDYMNNYLDYAQGEDAEEAIRQIEDLADRIESTR